MDKSSALVAQVILLAVFGLMQIRMGEAAVCSPPCSVNHTECVTFIGEPVCHCKAGFDAEGTGPKDVTACIDSNECVTPVGQTVISMGCLAGRGECVNTIGSWVCKCKDGYQQNMTDAARSCIDIDECQGANDCKANENCTNTVGGHGCIRNDCKVTETPFNDGKCYDLNECATNNHGCDSGAKCTKDPKSLDIYYCGNSVCFNQHSTGHHCYCNTPYYKGNGSFCEDVDECAEETHDCANSQFCKNLVSKITTIGEQGTKGWECTCRPGYEAKGALCVDIDECAKETDSCHDGRSNCTNLVPSYNCTCLDGFEGDGKNCSNIDECSRGIHNCDDDAICQDFAPGFNCTCKPFYKSKFGNNSAIKGHCEDVDECEDGIHNCDSNAKCTNKLGAWNCSCKAGYSGNGTSCKNLDECQLNTHDCPKNTSDCADTDGWFNCTCRSPAYKGDSGYKCEDVDECGDDLHDCHDNATCTNAVGNFSCKCYDGYSGDGTNCTDIDECSSPSLNTCHPKWSECTNRNGSYDCNCKTGFWGNGHNCSDQHECDLGTATCHSNATCNNTVGWYNCTCHPGFHGDGINCTDINECDTTKPCDSGADCTNVEGSYKCACRKGHRDLYDAKNATHRPGHPGLCPDINECENMTMGDGEHRCHMQATCTNFPGGYNCTCREKYGGDGYNCTLDMTSDSIDYREIVECQDANTEYTGVKLGAAPPTPTPTPVECQKLCAMNSSCTHWSMNKGLCTQLSSKTSQRFVPGASAGPQVCANVKEVIHEQTLHLKGAEGIVNSHLFLSTVSGDMPGTVLQNGPYKLDTAEVPIMFFSSSMMRPIIYNWYLITTGAVRNTMFQYGGYNATYDVESKCRTIMFTERMADVPAVILQLMVTHKLQPFFLDYTLVWTKNVTRDGFTACLHEAVLFSGEHKADISYFAVAQDNYRVFREKTVLHFPRGQLKCNTTEHLPQFCETIHFKSRYQRIPRVFLSTEIDYDQEGAGEQATWILSQTDRSATVCTKNTEDDIGYRNFAANVSVVISSREEYHVCNNVTVPENYECSAKHGGGYTIHCQKAENCPKTCNRHVCAADKGTYLDECHKRAETCAMYGDDYTKYVQHTSEDLPELTKCTPQLYPHGIKCGFLSKNLGNCHAFNTKKISTSPTTNNFSVDTCRDVCASTALCDVFSLGENANAGLCHLYKAGADTECSGGKASNDNWLLYSVTECPEKDPVLPYQAGHIELPEDHSDYEFDTYCKMVEVNVKRFNNISDWLVVTSVSFPENDSHVGYQPKFSTWTERINNTHFTACLYANKLSARASGIPHLHYVVYQKNLHRRIYHAGGDDYSMRGDSFDISKDERWRRSSLCKDIDMGPMSNSSKVFLTVHHAETGNYPALKRRFHIESWLEYRGGVGVKTRVCARSMEMFSASKTDVNIHWLVVHPDKVPTNDARMEVMRDVSYPLHDNTSRTTVCKPLTDAEPKLAGKMNKTATDPVMLVGVKALVPESVFEDDKLDAFAVPMASWMEEVDGKNVSMCYQGTLLADKTVTRDSSISTLMLLTTDDRFVV